MSGSTPDPYALLGVLPTATAPEIARAYRRLLRDHHPDTSTGPRSAGPGHPLALDEVRAAYALLRDPAARAEYDRARPTRTATAHRRAALATAAGPAPYDARHRGRPARDASSPPSATSRRSRTSGSARSCGGRPADRASSAAPAR